jgi:hypothetical protein
VETADGLRLPCAATIAAHSSARPLHGVCPGDDAFVGDGRLAIGPLRFDVVRWWSPRRPRPLDDAGYDVAALTAVSRLLPELSIELAQRLTALTDALARDGDVSSEVHAMLGLGAGLTPEGDDVLAGLLVTSSAVPAARLQLARLAAAVTEQAPLRTTTLSAALLRDAADGVGVPALVDFVDALHRSSGDDCAPPASPSTPADVVVRLLAVGHTSGASLAHGALAAARLHATMTAGTKVA